MIRQRPWLVFALVFAWKTALFIFTVQPVPANDAFFFDGAVVHHLLQGGYFNPCIAQAFPISATQVFSAYPPGYQAPLLAWMSVFGVSALSSMALHLAIFGLQLLVWLAIFRRLQIPAWCVNVAGAFLLVFTFDDRPDSFAHLLGSFALYACVRSRRFLGGGAAAGSGVWAWLMALFIVLALTTSFQIGTTYLGVVFICTVAACHFGGEKMPLAPLAAMILVPVALVLLAKFELPRASAGFLENARQTPFFSGWHWLALGGILKIIRTAPAVLLIAVLLPVSWFKQHFDFESSSGRREEIILLAALLPALGIIAASLLLISANTVSIASYLQPLIVAVYLALTASLRTGERWLRLQVICLMPAILLVSVRAVGMTTWGVACAMDFSYADSVKRVEAELAGHPPGYQVVMSSPFLYGAARHNDVTFIHSDWLMPAKGDSRITDVQGLAKLKPEKLILTQFDYYRRFQTVLDLAKTNPDLLDVQVINTARTRAPDWYPPIQQVVQHISWAPVIVNLSWRK